MRESTNLKEKKMRVEVAYPECVRIELVQSNDLRPYEMFGWLGSLSTAAAVGFWTAYLTLEKPLVLLSVSIVFTLLTLVFIGVAWYLRGRMNTKKIIQELRT